MPRDASGMANHAILPYFMIRLAWPSTPTPLLENSPTMWSDVHDP
jgi:hypothetical protein